MSPAQERAGDEVVDLCRSLGCTPETANHAELMLHRHCRAGRGSEAALYFDGEVFSYSDIAGAAAKCAAWIRSLGIVPGERVILILPDCPTLAAAYFGVVATGAIAVILDCGLPVEDVFYIAQLCGAHLVIAYSKFLPRFSGLRSAGGMISVMGAGVKWTQPSDFASAIENQNPDDTVSGNSDGFAYGLLSSGSTGRPKLIPHRHQDILYGYLGFARSVLRLHKSDRNISVAKMTTGYGLGCSLLIPFLEGASSALVSQSPNAAVMANAIEAHRCTLLYAQPRFLADVVTHKELAAKIRSLRIVITGGEPLANSLLDRWTEFSQSELLDSYGATEVGFLYISNRAGEARRGSVGKCVEGLQVEVVDESGQTVAPGQIGRLRVRGPMVIKGYWNDPARSEQAFSNGWFVTSDMFSFDEDGYYYIHGRSDHLIKLGCGDWVNPAELERAMLEHAQVRECAVVGSPDGQGLTILKAVVVTDSVKPADQELARELGELVRDRWPMQEYKRIGAVEFVQELPKTAAGKLDRARLRPQSMTEFSYKC